MGTTRDTGGDSILERNLCAIAKRSPRAADAIRGAKPSANIEFVDTLDEGAPSAVLQGRALCSKRRPLDEARSWCASLDPNRAGFFGVIGFGMGYHLRALQEAHHEQSASVCFEPDVGLLRAVLERLDHSEWINRNKFTLVTDPRDQQSIGDGLKKLEVLLATGVELVTHPPSRARLEAPGKVFGETFLEAVKITRTHLVTILAHSGITLRNVIMNADHYASCAGLGALKDSCTGKAAILIAAGPSLRNNLALLEDPEVRERFVIIAVQTMLKPLLERGIKPHFVTSLDHHEISRRFYEGLTPEDVEGVRLIAEPKANAAILDAFPGEIVCVGDESLDKLLGPDIRGDKPGLPAGSTVAHLNYYIARFMGCDTIIMIGQDLGFSDGLYYGDGATIHNVWSGELSEHRTLEMMELERVLRMKAHLRTREDVHGREMFADEQMCAYIAQFESDFAKDAREGVRIIDASEGGARIAHTEVMTLRDAIARHASPEPVVIPETVNERRDDPAHLALVRERARRVIDDLKSIAAHSDSTIELIERGIKAADDPARVDRIIAKIHAIREKVHTLEPALTFVHFLNQRGALARFRADRRISLAAGLDRHERQIRQLERDGVNVRGIRTSADAVRALIERLVDALDGRATKLTRDEFANERELLGSGAEVESRRRVDAVIFADPTMGPLGQRRDLSEPVAMGMNALALTIERLRCCEQIDGITILTPDPGAITRIMGEHGRAVRVVSIDADRYRARTRSVGLARSASSDTWRGSIASIGCYDEGFDPVALAQVMESHGIDAAAIVGPDWALVDPALVDEIVSLHRREPEKCRIPFSQAVPGIGCVVLAREIAMTLAKASAHASVYASIGAMLSYVPRGPQSDPIASPLCVGIDPRVRDASVRVIADSNARRRAFAEVYESLGDRVHTARAVEIVDEYDRAISRTQRHGPGRLVLELCTGRLTSGFWGRAHHRAMELDERPNITLASARDAIRDALSLRDDCTVLFSGVGDPLMRPDALDFVALADELGAPCVELRTDLLSEHHDAPSIIESGVGVLSVDILADSREVYQQMTGTDRYDHLLDRMQSLFDTRERVVGSFPTPWILPRLTKCSINVHELRNFYDRWLSICGCAAIDPLPQRIEGERITPLPIPKRRAHALEHDTMRVRADGAIVDHAGVVVDAVNAFEDGIEAAHRALRDHRAEMLVEPKAEPVLAGASSDGAAA
jgi:hypothetical protein